MSRRRTIAGFPAVTAAFIVCALVTALSVGVAVTLLITERDDARTGERRAKVEQAITEDATASLLDEIDTECDTIDDPSPRQTRICDAAEETAQTITGDPIPGPPGADGVDGLPGASIVGPQGERGQRGPRGFIGPVGPQGVPGADGRNGADGSNGTDGDDSSVPGPQGPPGADGQDGADGRDGNAVPGTYQCPDPDQFVFGITFTPDGAVVLDCRPSSVIP